MAGSIAQNIADPYAEALLAVGTEQKIVDDLGQGCRLILETLESSPELQAYLANPLIKPDQKKTVCQQLFGEQIPAILLTILYVLTDRRRVMFSRDVCLRYLMLQRKLQNVALAEVTSATPLTEAQQAAVTTQVQQLTKATGVELQLAIDPDLIGGVVIRVGSQVIDASLRGQLRRLALQLV